MKKYPKIQPFAEDAYKSYVREEVLNPLILQHNGLVDDVEALYLKDQIVDAEILAMESSVSKMEEKVNNVVASEAETIEALLTIKEDLSSLESKVDEFPAQVVVLEDKIKSLEEVDSSIADNVQLVDDKVTGLGNIVSGFDNIHDVMNQRLSEAEELISTSNENILAISGDVVLLKDKAAIVEEEVISITEAIDLIKGDLTDVGIRVASNESGISYNKDHISQVSDEMLVVRDKLKSLELAIEDCSGGGSGGGSDLTPIIERLDSIEEGQTALSNAVETLSSRVDVLEADTGGSGGEVVSDGFTVVSPSDDIQALLDTGTKKIKLLPGALYIWDNVMLPSGTHIIGNQAILRPSGLNAILKQENTQFNGRTILENLIFEGQEASAVNSGIVPAHVGFSSKRSYQTRITGCIFRNFRGAGLTFQGDSKDNVYQNAVQVDGNIFYYNFCGVSACDRSEFSQIINNNFSSCRVAVINTSGNWMVNNNIMTTCTCGYFTINKPTPWGSYTGDNWCHGTFVGNKINHSDSGGKPRYNSNTNIPCSGVNYNPVGAMYVDGVLPPTISSNTCYYSSMEFKNLSTSMPTVSLVGCVFSTCRLVSPAAGIIKLVGCNIHGTRVSFTNINKATDCWPPIA